MASWERLKAASSTLLNFASIIASVTIALPIQAYEWCVKSEIEQQMSLAFMIAGFGGVIVLTRT